MGNYFSEIRNTYQPESTIYKYSTTDKDFKLYGEITGNGVTQIRFFQASFIDDIFVSVTNEKGNCIVYELNENAVGRFQKFHEFDVSCTAMEMFEQKDKGKLYDSLVF